jgi:hypothetical protein
MPTIDELEAELERVLGSEAVDALRGMLNRIIGSGDSAKA